MNKRVFSLLLVIVGVALVLAACGGNAAPAATKAPVVPAATDSPVATTAPTEAPVALSGDSIRGGRMYNSWIAETGADAPTEINPVWKASAAGDVSVTSSWSCSKCHGYDYAGTKDFVGILADAGKDPNEILAILKGSTDANHDFSSVMDDQALTDLALFVSNDMLDPTVVVVDNKPVNGNADNGKTLYDNTCIDCHGPEGLAINFGADNSVEYPFHVAEIGPKILHKLRFGQPGVEQMPAGIDNSWTNQNYADVIVFLQATPAISPVTEGGRMYDNWFAAFKADAPTTTQPLWTGPLESGGETIAAEDTWRCASCHGWDYNGDAGFKGILADKDMSAADLTAWLDGTKNADHNYSTYFTADDMGRMVAFIQQGMVDKSTFINADGTANGDAAHGKELFNTSCKTCHGEDGKAINFMEGEGGEEYFGSVATEAPFEFFNKASVGQPGEAMPAGLNLGWTLQDFADVLAYAQTLPTK